ncbi:MAG TPA: MATE family efflux transporter, partial [Verrucomicrobiae bacterium]|nr:MATE family efflux transporter [Verrucomicrobiae bacterium]
ATTLVGQALGAKDPELAMESGFMATKISAVVMSVMGIVFYVLAKPMVWFFSTDPEVVSLAVMALRIVAISQPVLAVVMCLAGALRGAGDTRWVMYITAMSYWGVRLTLSYVLAITLGFGLMGAWISMTIELFVRGGLSFWRYNSGRWKEIKV